MRHREAFINHQINNPIMKKIIVSCLAVVTLALISGCASEGTHSTTTTSQQTTVPGPISTTTTDTQTK
jgi:type IV pilus biogenesis protein CpaD/CtpE